MARPSLEVADIFRDHGAAWRDANRGHVSLGQLKVMSAIENCRTAALNAATDALDDCDRDARIDRGGKPSLLLYRVVCVDEDTTLWPACDLGNLRLALNALVRAFGRRR